MTDATEAHQLDEGVAYGPVELSPNAAGTKVVHKTWATVSELPELDAQLLHLLQIAKNTPGKVDLKVRLSGHPDDVAAGLAQIEDWLSVRGVDLTQMDEGAAVQPQDVGSHG